MKHLKSTFIALFICIVSITAHAQGNIGIGTSSPDSSAILDLSSTDKGFLIPRMNSFQRIGINQAAIGLLVFDTTTDSFWYNTSTGWKEFGTFSSIGVPGTNFISDQDGNTIVHTEKTENDDVISMSLGGLESMILSRSQNSSYTSLLFPNNGDNIVIGQGSMILFTPGDNNTVLGNNVMRENSFGFQNVAIGNSALNANTEGFQNTAVGVGSLKNNTIGNHNTALGFEAMGENVDGDENTAIGYWAMLRNTGDFNTAVGRFSLSNNMGSYNTAIGEDALSFNKTGSQNIGIGASALSQNEDGNNNTSVGSYSLWFNTSGNNNVAIGHSSLSRNELGLNNTSIGTNALKVNTNSRNTAVGSDAMLSNISGSDNTAVGYGTLSNDNDGNGNIGIGYFSGAKSNGNNNIFLGNYIGENLTGNSNIVVGHIAGEESIGSNNIYFGNNSGSSLIENNRFRLGSNSLIYGEFDNNKLQVNGDLHVTGSISTSSALEFDDLQINGELRSEILSVIGMRVDLTSQGHLMNLIAQVNPFTQEVQDGIRITIPKSETSKNNRFVTFENNTGVIGKIAGFKFPDDWNPPALQEDLSNLDDILCFLFPIIGGFPTSPPPIIFLEIAAAIAEAEIGAACLDGGVIYESGNGDYAEWLERRDPTSNYIFGQVVGVKGGKISLNTDDAEQILVVSLAPIMLGNMPKEGKERNYEKVAFMGQVPVRIRGTANSGDYLIPSGYEDGTAIAIPEKDLNLEDLSKIFGRAWSEGKNPVKNLINAVVGVRTPELAKLFESIISGIKNENVRLNEKVNDLKADAEDLSLRMERLEKIILTSSDTQTISPSEE